MRTISASGGKSVRRSEDRFASTPTRSMLGVCMIGRRFHNIWLGCEKLLGLNRIVLTALAWMVRVSDVTGYEWRFFEDGAGV